MVDIYIHRQRGNNQPSLLLFFHLFSLRSAPFSSLLFPFRPSPLLLKPLLTDCGKPHCNRRSFSNFAEHLSLAISCDVMGYFKIPESTCKNSKRKINLQHSLLVKLKGIRWTLSTLTSGYHGNAYPPAPLAGTTLSGMRSRSK